MSAVPSMPFGKFKGTPIAELDAEYLAWIAGREDLRDPVKGWVNAELARRASAPKPAKPTSAKTAAAPSPPRRHVCPKCSTPLLIRVEVTP